MPSIIQELQDACRQSLYDGNSLGIGFASMTPTAAATAAAAASSSVAVSDASDDGSSWKRQRIANQDETSRNWEVVSSMHSTV